MNKNLFPWLYKLFIEADKRYIRRTKNLKLIPDFRNRRCGKTSYAEWAHVMGIYQTIEKKNNNKILDIGCGTGLLGIASEPFISEDGIYTRTDVMTGDINFCKTHFNLKIIILYILI